jgi:dihydrofolate reductase
MPIYSIIVCTSENGIIGDKGRMLWDKKRGDYMRFSGLTPNHTLIMGKTTYIDTITRLKDKGWSTTGELGKGRKAIVLSFAKDFTPADDAIIATSIEEAQDICKNEEEVFITGGASIFKQLLPYSTRIYLTVLHTVAQGDVTFEIPDREQWIETYKEEFKADDRNEFDYTFYTLERADKHV